MFIFIVVTSPDGCGCVFLVVVVVVVCRVACVEAWVPVVSVWAEA